MTRGLRFVIRFGSSGLGASDLRSNLISDVRVARLPLSETTNQSAAAAGTEVDQISRARDAAPRN
jgi:hypothetical protein